MATRATTADAFGTPSEQTNLSTAANETDPTMTPDGLTLYYTSDVSGLPRLYRAKRATTSASFSNPVLVPELASAVVYGPVVSPDGTELFYEDNSKIMTRATVSGDAITVVGEVPELGTQVGFATLSPDGLTIYFEQLLVAGSDNDIYMATRPAIGQPFSAPVVVAELQTSGLDDDPDMTQGGNRLYYASDRDGVSEDLYVVDRLCQ
jgi:hypothetical protein